jgi:hypothetical protein
MYRTVIRPVVSYGYEAWSVILSEVHRLRVFENGVLRKIFVPKRDEVTGEWRRLIMRNFMICSLPNIVWMMKSRTLVCSGCVVHLGVEGKRGAYRVLVGRSREQRLRERPRHRWEDIIKMGWETWFGLLWLRVGTGACECGNEPSGSIKC